MELTTILQKADFTAQIADITQTIQKERRVFEASLNLFKQLKDMTAKDQCEAAMIESQKRLTFLESRCVDIMLRLVDSY